MKVSTEPTTADRLKPSLMIKLVLFPCLMFGFGFLLIPLYDVFCDITGLNGKFDLDNQQALIQQDVSISSQKIILQFTAASDQKKWQFQPNNSQLEINTGQQYQTFFTLHNPTKEVMEFTSIPSISPGLAAEYLIKTECFCFQKQILQPGEKVEMPLVFQLRNDTPQEYTKLTLAYRIYAKALERPAHEQLNTSLDE